MPTADKTDVKAYEPRKTEPDDTCYINFKLPANEDDITNLPGVEKTEDPAYPYRMNRDEYHKLAFKRGW